MRYNLKVTIIATLTAAMLITSTSGCKTNKVQPEQGENTNDTSVVEQIGVTREFKNSALRKHWYNSYNIEEKYKELLKEYTPIKGKFHEKSKHQIYKDAENKEYFINGVTPVLVSDWKLGSVFKEKTGERLYIDLTEKQVNEMKENQKVTEEVLTGKEISMDSYKYKLILNNDLYEIKDIVEDTGENEFAVNINLLTGIIQNGFTHNEEEQTLIVHTSPMDNTSEMITLPVKEDYEQVNEPNGDSYLSAKVNDKGDIFVPISVIINKIGWDTKYISSLQTLIILTDDCYNIKDDNGNVIMKQKNKLSVEEVIALSMMGGKLDEMDELPDGWVLKEGQSLANLVKEKMDKPKETKPKEEVKPKQPTEDKPKEQTKPYPDVPSGEDNNGELDDYEKWLLENGGGMYGPGEVSPNEAAEAGITPGTGGRDTRASMG